MPFRFLMPMAEEMIRHQAQAMLDNLSVARLAPSDLTKAPSSDILRSIEDRAKGVPRDDDTEDRLITKEDLDAMMAVMGFREA